MSSSKGWSVLALLIGVGGLGLSGYTLFFALPQKSGIQNVWYDSNLSTTSFDVVGINVIIPNLSIIATVKPGESLHVIFNAEVILDLDGGPEYLRVFVSLNSLLIGTPNAYVGGWPQSTPLILYEDITLHYSNLSISPGLYNVGMMAESQDASNPNSISKMTLLVFTSR